MMQKSHLPENWQYLLVGIFEARIRACFEKNPVNYLVNLA